MYIYKFIDVLAYQLRDQHMSYRNIITDMAKDGWRFVCAVPTVMSDDGKIIKMDLVFEKGNNCL